MPNALLAETRTKRIDLALPILPQLRISPTVYEILDEAKSDAQSWPDFALESMLIRALLPHTLGLRLRDLNRQIVRIVGPEPDAAAPPLTDVRTSAERQDCPYSKRQMEVPGTLVEARKRGQP